jgi:signal transduction histidine kinase/ActR/RegA family two-component response regulator
MSQPFFLGTKNRYTTAENRITIFCNVLAIFGSIAGVLYYIQLSHYGIQGVFLLSYLCMGLAALFVLVLNHKGYHVVSRIFVVTLMQITSWNALIFFGKSFNGYYLFFVSIVFSIVAFPSAQLKARWLTLLFSLSSLPLADYFSHYRILPITQLNSSQFPVAILVIDTLIVSLFLVSILLIEKLLSEKNEKDLTVLNKNLEQIVKKRTALLDSAREGALAASRAKSRFIANTSHELRTPLGAIIGFVDLVLDTNPDEKQKRQYLEVVRKNAHQLLQIVNEVLDLSKIEAEKIEIEKCSFQLKDLIEDIQSLMSLKAETKGLLFYIELDKPLPEIVYTDPLRLKQILINLIGNAIKFTSQGEVRVKVSQIQSSKNFITLQFDISDTGPGIDAEFEKYLFEAFSQADSSLVRKYGGTGLGLSLSRSLAKLLNGELVLQSSTPGKGSVFRLKIDIDILNQQTQTAVERKSGQIESKQRDLIGKMILVVDDSMDNQILIKQYLSKAGAQVDLAENGQKAIDMIEINSNSYDVILMDLQMPVLDGYQTTKRLRENGCKIPIVAFTAHAMKEERDKAKASGFNGYLTKPIERQVLISTLADITRSLNQSNPS